MTHPVRRMVTAVLVSACAWLATPNAQKPTTQATYVADEVLVRFKPETSRGRSDALIASRGGRVVRRMEHVGVHQVRLPAGASIETAIAAFQRDPDVLDAQPNFIRQIVGGSNDPYWTDGTLWGLEKIQAAGAWVLTTGSPAVIVADIDTGVNYAHPDLAANMWRNPGEVAANGLDDDNNGYVDDVYGIDAANNDSDPMDDHGHGTHTAGTIGAVGNNGAGVVGVNWNVKILPCKFIKASGSGADADAIECFNYIVALKKKGIDIRVTSNSWGGPRSGSVPTSLKAAIDAAGAQGILNVFAAGNSGANIDTTPFDPASLTSDSIIAVAASDKSDLRPSFSNYGATSVDLAAPGVSIVSTGLSGYVAMSGTSMAAPHVAGAAALVSNFNPTLTCDGLKSVLLSSVDALSPWSGVVASGGRLNVFSAALDANGDVAPTVSLTAPSSGSSFAAPATIALTAAASDADGTLSKVEFFANGSLVGSDTTSPYSVTASNVAAGTYALTAIATDDRGFSTTSDAVSVTVTEPTAATTSRTNVALASNGARVSASSTYSSTYAASHAINGSRRATAWSNTWADQTSNTYPDWLQVDFNGSKTIEEIDVITGQQSSAVDPTLATTSPYAATAFQVQYWTGTAWTAVTGGTVSGNNRVWRQFMFAAITTSAIRVSVTASGNALTRIAEIEAYEATAAPPPPPPSGERVNVALAASGATVSASSTYSSNYAASYAIDGNRRATAWTTTWADQTANAFPDWLQVSFNASKTIEEIDVITGQQSSAVDPTLTTTSPYAATAYQVQYWTGTAWATVTGGSVSGNNRVWRQFVFQPIATTAIRVLITGSGNSLSRIAEIEAYESATTAPPPSTGGGIDVALASNGARVSASSIYSSNYATAYAIDGNRLATPWSSTWADQTTNIFPDWLQVDFNGSKTIHEIDVFTGQQNASLDPTLTLTSPYAATTFQVQYWTGSQWTTVPGGSVTGNTLVWRQFVFQPIATTAIRVWITGGGSTLSRIAEIEAYQSSTGSSSPLIGFPPDNWWSLDVSSAPVDPNSANYIAFINNGSIRRLHPDFGGEASPGSVQIYGLPYLVVDSTVPKKAVQFYYSRESDGVEHTTNISFPFYPIPDAAITEQHLIEGGYPGNVDRRGIQDRHLLIVDRDRRHLYELYNVFYDGTKWVADCGAFFDMNTNNRRPEGWTSADAAGLAILPGLVRYDEVFGTTEIQHAFRMTVRATNGYVYPASHRAGSTVGALPMGARLRLKAGKDISSFTPEVQRIFRAMKKYGLMVADNGSDMFITGTYDPRWDMTPMYDAFRALNANDFEVIALGQR